MLSGPPLNAYYGSKYRLADWIASQFPVHTCYVEPYGGGAAVLLARTHPAPVEVYNDLDRQVVTTFRVIRDRLGDLSQAVAWTPYARAELVTAYTTVAEDHPDRDLEIARRFLVRAWQSRGGGSTRQMSGWRFQKSDRRCSYQPAKWAGAPERIAEVAARLKHVQIEYGPALDIIARFDAPGTLFYLDPPYLQATCSMQWKNGGYRCEMDETEHRALAEVLHHIRGMAVISGHPHALYRELYADWRQVCATTGVHGQQRAMECLWLSPATLRHAIQPPLFECASGVWCG